jgi:ppGpp synthetase/RelA/SpoT-type nucleotidyltranferase
MILDVDQTEDGNSESDGTEKIQIKAHDARVKYESIRGLYEDFAKSVADVIERCLAEANIPVQSITFRAKDPDSFERKAAQSADSDLNTAKYDDPLEQITDKAGVRIITYFLNTVDEVCALISEQFRIVEKITKISSEPDRLGYQSIHYLLTYLDTRTALLDFKRFANLVVEVQVRTILQHAWAEIEHDIQYKAVAVLPARITRRFATLAGLIEIADREFQAIEDENRIIRDQARRNVDLGKLDEVEITGDSVRAYLDKKYGSDGRMSDFSYQYTARALLALGFVSLAEVDECIREYDDDAISRTLHGSRQGQIRRFEDVLLASMGENYVKAHPWSNGSYGDWHIEYTIKKLAKLRAANKRVGEYRPLNYPDTIVRDADLEAIKAVHEQVMSASADPSTKGEPPA